MIGRLLWSFVRTGFGAAAPALAVWLMAAGVWAAPPEKVCIVKRGDTLSGIAVKHGLPLARLAERNGLGKDYRIYAGQRLFIPAKHGAPLPRPTPLRAALPARVQRAIDEANVEPGRWQHLVIHHSGVNTGTMKGMDTYHREVRHMENGLAYHFIIGNGRGLANGEIGVGARWTRQLDGGHLFSETQNKISLGICLVGNFDKEKPTAKQMERLTALVQALLRRCGLKPAQVRTHQQINVVHTRCPGLHFPSQTFLQSLNVRIAKPRSSRAD